MWRVKDNADMAKMEKLYQQVLDGSLNGKSHVTGALANLVGVMENMKNGQPAVSREVKKVIYKDSKCLEIKLAK